MILTTLESQCFQEERFLSIRNIKTFTIFNHANFRNLPAYDLEFIVEHMFTKNLEEAKLPVNESFSTLLKHSAILSGSCSPEEISFRISNKVFCKSFDENLKHVSESCLCTDTRCSLR